MKAQEFVEYKHFFSPDEKADIAKSQSEEIQKMNELEDEKKAVMADFKAKIDQCKASMNLFSRYYRDGWKYSQVLAEKRKNYNEKVWEFIHPETGEIILTKPLKAEEMQMDIPIIEAEVIIDITPESTIGDAKLLGDGSEAEFIDEDEKER